MAPMKMNRVQRSGLGIVGGLALGIAGLANQFVPMALAQETPETISEPEAISEDEPTDSCLLLEEITTGETAIRKRIENRLISRGNWSTDFTVPSNEFFNYYAIIFTPEHNAPYELIVNFKQRGGLIEQVYYDRVDLAEGETYALMLQSPTGQQPFQINTRVGGTNGDVYTLSIAACAG